MGKRTSKTAVVKRDVLTDKERMFIEQYFLCKLNGTEAALATFDTTDRATAAAIASEYLAKPKIRTRVDARLDQFHMAANELLARIAFDARGSMEDFINPYSGTVDLKKAAAAKSLGLLKRFKTKFTTTSRQIGENTTEDIETVETEIELYDGQAARRDLAKHLGLFAPDTVINFNTLSDADLEAIANGKAVKTISVEAGK